MEDSWNRITKKKTRKIIIKTPRIARVRVYELVFDDLPVTRLYNWVHGFQLVDTQHNKTSKFTYAPSKYSDQSAYLCNLINVRFAFSGKPRSFCWFWYAAAHSYFEKGSVIWMTMLISKTVWGVNWVSGEKLHKCLRQCVYGVGAGGLGRGWFQTYCILPVLEIWQCILELFMEWQNTV